MQSNFALPTIAPSGNGSSKSLVQQSPSTSRDNNNNSIGNNNNNSDSLHHKHNQTRNYHKTSNKTALSDTSKTISPPAVMTSSINNKGGNDHAKQAYHHQPQVVELNVGGHYYTTTLSTLLFESNSLLTIMFSGNIRVAKDSRGRYFIDRDGQLFRFILDYLRNDGLTLPKNFEETDRLLVEADYFRLTGLRKLLHKPSQQHQSRGGNLVRSSSNNSAVGGGGSVAKKQTSGYITLCVRGTYAFGRDGIADIKFRKLQRILVCGNVGLSREVFHDSVNETRDPDRELIGYSSRFYLKHPHLEMAFDRLHEANFKMVTSAAGGAGYDPESEETKWNHFTNYVFFRSWKKDNLLHLSTWSLTFYRCWITGLSYFIYIFKYLYCIKKNGTKEKKITNIMWMDVFLYLINLLYGVWKTRIISRAISSIVFYFVYHLELKKLGKI